jgi:large subunit ribosomal protein L21e
MGRKSKGYRAKSRSLLRKKPRERGKIGLSTILHEYKPGEKVVIKINPSIHKGMPHRRYHGRVGVITKKSGRAYILKVTQGNATKEIIARPEHLKPMAK